MKIQILGTRGIPAKHGGFETFAEHLAIYLQHQNWDVTVYCQENGTGEIYEDNWHGIHRVHIPVSQQGAGGTIIFDWKSTIHATKKNAPVLILGYNTAIFTLLYRLKGIKNLINMDGIEWGRKKWSFWERSWLYINEKIGAWLANHLVADHPEIKNHLVQYVSESKVSVIPYGADLLSTADPSHLIQYNLEQNKYAIVIARPEPENSIIEIVRAYSKTERGIPLVIMGNYTPDSNEFHKAVLDAAGNEVKFLGAIYDKKVVQSLRFFARFYIHGHTVGGTNPSLVEALGAGTPILAHNNKFNRWVAGKGACFFSSEDECAKHISTLLRDDNIISSMRKYSFKQARDNFTLHTIHQAYEKLLLEKLF